MKKYIHITFFLFMLFSSLLIAQQQKGDSELGFNGYYFTAPSPGSGVGVLNVKYGYFFTDNLEIGIGPSFTFTEKKTTVGSSVFFQFAFLTRGAVTVPYFGAQYFKMDFDTEDSGNAGATAGLKFYLKKNVSFDFGISYLVSLDYSNAEYILVAAGLFFIL